MPSKRKRLRKTGIKTLDFFLNASSSQEIREHREIGSSEAHNTVSRRDELDTLVNELFKPLSSSGSSKRTGINTKEPIEEKPIEAEKRVEMGSPREIKLQETPIPRGEILHKLLEKPIRTVNEIMCGPDGLCRDNRRLSEVFIDEYGFKRQRGFVRTTRLPVFLDWIIEEAVVTKILPTAYKVKTSRGAVALVPENFLCELDKRYGVILKNYDCSNYKLSITPSEKKKR